MYLSLVISALYIILMLFVIFKLRKVKISTGYKVIIGLFSVAFAPGGYFWYRLERKKNGVKNDPKK